MTKFQDRTPPGENGVMERLQALEREVQELRAARRLEASTIGKGGITVKGGAIILQRPDGTEIARLGARSDLLPEPGGQPQSGFILRRNDGSIAFTVDDPDPTDGYKQILKISDASGNNILAEDANSGFGLGAPFISAGVFYNSDVSTMPGSNSTSLFQVMTGVIPVSHPRAYVSIGAYVPGTAGLTGTIQLKANGVSQGNFSLPNNSFGSYDWILDLKAISGSAYNSQVGLEILVSRTGGTAADFIRVSPNYAVATGT